jgi:hypothetical protein
VISSKESYDKLLEVLGKTLGIKLAFEDDSCHLQIEELDLGCCIRKFESQIPSDKSEGLLVSII